MSCCAPMPAPKANPGWRTPRSKCLGFAGGPRGGTGAVGAHPPGLFGRVRWWGESFCRGNFGTLKGKHGGCWGLSYCCLSWKRLHFFLYFFSSCSFVFWWAEEVQTDCSLVANANCCCVSCQTSPSIRFRVSKTQSHWAKRSTSWSWNKRIRLGYRRSQPKEDGGMK